MDCQIFVVVFFEILLLVNHVDLWKNHSFDSIVDKCRLCEYHPISLQIYILSLSPYCCKIFTFEGKDLGGCIFEIIKQNFYFSHNFLSVLI